MNVSISWKHNILLFICFSLFSLAHHSVASEYHLESPAEWVNNTPTPAVESIPTDQISNGIYYRLVERQIRVTDTDKASYSRWVEMIVNQSGVEQSSQINIDFDPRYERIVMHGVSIIRNGQIIDKLKTAKISVFNRESDLKKQIYNGEQTLNILIDDIQVGDTIDYHFTREGQNPVYEGLFSYRAYLNWSVPVHDQIERVLWGKSVPLYVNKMQIDVPVETKQVGKFTEYSIHVSQTPTLQVSDDTPSWYDPYGIVYFSEMSSWKGVVDWAKTLYAFDNKLPDVLAIANQIDQSESTTEGKVAAALRYVQSEIRYVGLEMGLNSHLPIPPDKTMQLKYGDCKGKTLLLMAILDAMGIQSAPALVHTKKTKRLKDIPPVVNTFDHVITLVEVMGKRFWLDPTRSYQAGTLYDIYQPDYGYALVLKDGEKELTKMQPENGDNSVFVEEHYFIPSKVSEQVPFQVKNRFTGYEASIVKRNVNEQGLQGVTDSYLDHYQGIFDNLTLEKNVAFQDFDERGQIKLNEFYSIKDFWEPEEEGFTAYLYPYDTRGAIPKIENTNRNAPFPLTYPKKVSNKFVITFAEQGWDFKNQKKEIFNEFFHYTFEQVFNDKELIVTFTYEALTDHVPADKAAFFMEERQKVMDNAFVGMQKFGSGEEESTSETVVAPQSSDGEDLETWVLIALGFLAFYLLAILFVLISWRRESRRRPQFENAQYFPVSLSKFLILSIATFGLYDCYWMYRNWAYIKKRDALNVMPIVRGIFDVFWFLPLFDQLKKDSIKEYGKNKVLATGFAIVIGIAILVITCLSAWGKVREADFLLLFLPVLLVPLVSYINHVNGDDSEALAYNSKWHIKHFVLVLLFLPMMSYEALVKAGVAPDTRVVTQDDIASWDLAYLYRKNVIPSNEEIHYFYSDAFISVQDDGNGFTNNRVFSYWKDENNKLAFETATFNEIKDIQVKFAKSFTENTVITIKKLDDSWFTLFVTSEQKDDRKFVKHLKQQWRSQKNKVNDKAD